MIPTILQIGPIGLHSYGLCLAIALIVGHYLMAAELRRRKLDERFAGLCVTLAAVFGVAGARIFDIFEHPEGFFANPIKTLVSGAGLTWYGGFILATAAVWVAARIKRMPWWQVVDSAAPGLAIGYGFGRLGCLLSGDGCYGNACSAGLPVPLCMAFPKGIVPTTELVYNTPLWEIGGALVTFAYIWWVRGRVQRAPGLFLRFLVVHGILRFVVEFVRRNPELMFGLSQAQVLSVAMVLAGVAGLVWLAKQGPEPLPVAAAPAAAATADPAAGRRIRRKGRGRH